LTVRRTAAETGERLEGGDSASTDRARLLRAVCLWHFVFIGRALALGVILFFSGPAALSAMPASAMLLSLSFVLDGALCTFGWWEKRNSSQRRMIRSRWFPLIAWLGIALSTLIFTQFIFAVSATKGLLGSFDQIAAARIGIVLVGAAVAGISRPAFFVFAFATAIGGTAGTWSVDFGLQSLMFLCLLGAMVREDSRYHRRQDNLRAAKTNEQERAANLVRDFESAGRGWFWETDRHGNLVYISQVVAEKVGIAQRELIGRAFTDIIRKRGGSGESEERTLGFSLSSRTPFNDLTVQAAVKGEERWWSISGNPISNSLGHFLGFRGSGTDLTEMKRSEREINQLARYDTLTGLANRLHINELLERALRNHFGQPQPCAMFLMDLDRFKAVNDTLGHPVGDQLLQQVAGRIRQVVGDRGQVGRLGGDEFQVVIPQITGRDKLAEIANAIIISLAKPFAIEGEQVRIGCSVGIAISEGDGVPSSALVRNADLALYSAKDAGRGVYRFYIDAMHNHASERKAIEDALRDAIAKDQLKLLYQPVVDVASEMITGFEALIRWYHPTEGLISPTKFIPIAEEANLIVPIGDWIIRTACETVAQFGPQYRMAVNVSPRQFTNPNLPATIVNAVASAGIRPEQLELEITEGVFLDESAENMEMFQKLKRTGIRLALDDFGTGYSALGYLKKAPFDKIKIDQSFVRGAADRGGMNAAIISSIVSLAGALDMHTTAEGVETHDELDLIRSLGCSHVQGYIYGKPMAAEDAIALLRANGGKVAAHGYKSARENRKRTFRTVSVDHGGYRYEAIVRNVASGGAMVEGLWNVPVGTRFRIEFAPNMVIEATSRWAIDNRMGVEFERAMDIEQLAAVTPAMVGGAPLKMAS
jgi:diguanylate cyclase (GGDEF)-like protein/PAS domain S-box-containing protein